MVGTCIDCTSRTYDCHTKCEKYINAKAEHQRIKAEMTKKAILARDLNNYFKGSAIRHSKAKNVRTR